MRVAEWYGMVTHETPIRTRNVNFDHTSSDGLRFFNLLLKLNPCQNLIDPMDNQFNPFSANAL